MKRTSPSDVSSCPLECHTNLLQHEEVGERELLQPVLVATFAIGTGNLKRGKNELKILELDTRSCNEKLQDIKTEK